MALLFSSEPNGFFKSVLQAYSTLCLARYGRSIRRTDGCAKNTISKYCPQKYNQLKLLLSLILWLVGGHSAFALDDLDKAHLLGRTGFGLASARWLDYEKLSRDESVDFLLAQQRKNPITANPDFVGSDVYQKLFSGKLSKLEKKALKKSHVNKHRKELVLWWWKEMLATQSTLTERMTLFWHGHFTSDVRKAHPPFVFEQNQLFRQHGLGDFKVLLREVIKGPAMQLYLDNTKNRRGKPNENLARELLELFTLGIGHYSENDVREVARALTGWKVNKERTSMRFKKKHHDADEKTILNNTGNWGLQGVLDIVLASPRTAQFITERLWREFVSAKPDHTEVARLGKRFRESGYSIEELLKALLKSDAFWAPENRMALVKAPVELAIGAMRDYSMPDERLDAIVKLVRASGQILFYPPDVKGWRGHTAWLSTDKIVRRQTLLQKMLIWKRGQYRDNAKQLKAEVTQSITHDKRHFDHLMHHNADDSRLNVIAMLKKVLMNDLYQFK